jgi:hypothetical protein
MYKIKRQDARCECITEANKSPVHAPCTRVLVAGIVMRLPGNLQADASMSATISVVRNTPKDVDPRIESTL